MKKLIDIKFDGSCDNNSKFKFMGAGVATFFDGVYMPEEDVYKMVGDNGSSNISEWEAMLMAMKKAVELSANYANCSIRIYGDSQVIVKQFSGEYRIREPYFESYFNEAHILAGSLSEVLKGVNWIPRTMNKEADVLSKRAVTEYLKKMDML